mgnify:FL=1
MRIQDGVKSELKISDLGMVEYGTAQSGQNGGIRRVSDD